MNTTFSIYQEPKLTRFDVFWLWMLGNTPLKTTDSVFIADRSRWILKINDKFAIHTVDAPNFIHRALQKVLLGFRWEMK